MANLLYRPFIETMLAPGNPDNGHGGLTIDVAGGGNPHSGGSGATTGTTVLAVALVDDVGGYTFDVDDQWVSDLGTNIVFNGGASGTGAEEGELQNVIFVDSTNGVGVDADNLTMTGVGDNTESVNVIVLYQLRDDSNDLNPLLAHIDTGTGFDFTPNGSTVTITWAGSPDYVFSIGA